MSLRSRLSIWTLQALSQFLQFIQDTICMYIWGPLLIRISAICDDKNDLEIIVKRAKTNLILSSIKTAIITVMILTN